MKAPNRKTILPRLKKAVRRLAYAQVDFSWAGSMGPGAYEECEEELNKATRYYSKLLKELEALVHE